MSNIVLFKEKNRVSIAKEDGKNLEKKLTVLLGICSEIKGCGIEKSKLSFAKRELSEFLKRDFKQYDFSEIEQILKNGFAEYGTEYLNVSVASCVNILRRFEENEQNRARLQHAIQQFEKYKSGGVTEEEKMADELQKRISAFKRAKKKYEKGEVTENDVYQYFSLAYKYIKENLKDASIVVSKEKGQEILSKVNLMYNEKILSINALEKSFFDTLLEFIPREIMIMNMFRSVLFHIWALENFEIPFEIKDELEKIKIV